VPIPTSGQRQSYHNQEQGLIPGLCLRLFDPSRLIRLLALPSLPFTSEFFLRCRSPKRPPSMVQATAGAGEGSSVSPAPFLSGLSIAEARQAVSPVADVRFARRDAPHPTREHRRMDQPADRSAGGIGPCGLCGTFRRDCPTVVRRRRRLTQVNGRPRPAPAV
jgi:hypothetical protein